MVLGRDVDRTLRLLQTHIDKLRSWGMSAAVVYADRDGVLKTYGNAAIKRVVQKHAEEIFTGAEYMSRETQEDDEKEVQVILPKLDGPLEEWSFVVSAALYVHFLFAKNNFFHLGNLLDVDENTELFQTMSFFK